VTLGVPIQEETQVTEREISRSAAKRLAIIHHAQEVTGNVGRTTASSPRSLRSD
jgi:hypothetical protein